jgi:glycosyltransferase involved in cell wall biosynthesis
VVPALLDLSFVEAASGHSGGPIRALLVISNLEYGGAQRQVVEIANNADPGSLDLHLCSLSGYVPLACDLAQPARLHVVQKRFKFDLTVVPRLARLLRSLRTDVVHGYLFDAEIATRLAGRLAGTPLVVGSERNTDYYLKPRQLAAYRLTRSMVDLVIANSRAGAEYNRRTLGHAPEVYRVVHNGVDVQRFAPRDGGAARRELGIASDERVVGMFASFKEQKNHPLFFAAARRVLARLPRARFLLVGEELYAGMHGSGEYRRRMDRLVEESGIRERCLFLGNRPDVERLYCACDVTVLPSLFEGTPNVLLESMACEVPVVATAVSDNAYIVPEGRAGYLVPLGDDLALAERVCRLLEDETLRATMGKAAREWTLREFSSAQLVRKTEAVYRQGLEQRMARMAGARSSRARP